MVKRAIVSMPEIDPMIAAEKTAAGIIAKYVERMRWGDRKDDMAWLTDLRQDIVAAIQPMDVPASRLIDEQ